MTWRPRATFLSCLGALATPSSLGTNRDAACKSTQYRPSVFPLKRTPAEPSERDPALKKEPHQARSIEETPPQWAARYVQRSEKGSAHRYTTHHANAKATRAPRNARRRRYIEAQQRRDRRICWSFERECLQWPALTGGERYSLLDVPFSFHFVGTTASIHRGMSSRSKDTTRSLGLGRKPGHARIAWRAPLKRSQNWQTNKRETCRESGRDKREEKVSAKEQKWEKR